MTLRFVDGHCHLDHLLQIHPGRIAWVKAVGGALVGWSFAHRVESVSDLRAYWSAQIAAVEEVARAGVTCAFLVGVHPRNIPPGLRPETLGDLLRPLLDHPLCRGIGEIGLETASDREQEVFEAHLDLATEVAERDHLFGVHTPRQDKERVTRAVLAALARHPAAARRAVLDHATPVTAPWALEAGLRIGMSLSPLKSSADEVRTVLRTHPEAADRLCLNTDSGTRFFENLWAFVRAPGLPEPVARKVARDNAMGWFGLGDPDPA